MGNSSLQTGKCHFRRLADQIDKKLSMKISEYGPQIRGGFPIFHSRAKWKIKNGKWEMGNGK
jgi:hypothetical protein